MSETANISYKCPSCTHPLVYGVEGRLKCEACGNTYDVEDMELLYGDGSAEKEFDWGDYKKKFCESSEKLTDTVVYSCRYCGAEIETERTTSATRCPYCDNEVVISTNLTEGLKPNAIIPFTVDRETAMKSVKEYFKGKKLLPKNFMSEHSIGKIKGVYVPFWLFDADVDGTMNLEGTKVKTWSDSDYRYTQTSTYLVSLDGDMRFEKIPVDGSIKMDDDLMDSLEPFYYTGLKEFNSGYLSGYIADRFDDDPDSSLPRASARMKKSAFTVFRNAGDDGFSSITLKNSRLDLSDPSVSYVLLPVYLLTLGYGGKNYRFAVNGQTGKVVGELPVSKSRKILHFLAYYGIVTLVGSLLIYFLVR